MTKVFTPKLFLLSAYLLFFVHSLYSQTISYIIPDIGTTGQNTYVEFIGPYNQNGNFGADGVYNNNAGDPVQVVCANSADTSKVQIGPVVVSWNGKMVSTQVFVLPGVIPNSVDWQLLAPAYKIPLQVLLNGVNAANADTFYIVQSQPAIITAGAIVLGSGGVSGTRSRRGAMIFDSLIFQNGANVTVSTADCDPVTAGNQGFLPVHIFSLGRIFIDNGATVGVSAPGAQNPDAGPGGSGGGTESWTNNTACNGGANPNAAGSGFTGGGTEKFCCAETPGTGTGAGNACLGCGGNGLNGLPGGAGGHLCADEDVGAGGGGHPFGSSGIDGISPGGYGGGSGWQAYAGGGFGSDGTAVSAGSEGKTNGNMELAPFGGGSGGSGGVCGPGSLRGGGGGGGGALAFHAFFSSDLLATGQVKSTGGNGVNGATGYRGGGGGSGGGIMLTGKLNSQGNGIITISGGAGGIGPAGQGGNGGAGRVRVDGPFGTSPVISPIPGAGSSTSYIGPSTDTSYSVARSFNLTGSGNGQAINIFLKPIGKPWQVVANISGYTSTWTQNVILPCPDTVFLLTALQQVINPSAAQYTAEPSWVFSQAAANFLITNSHFVADFKADTACLNNATTFTDQSTAANQWNWNFGDGGNSTLQNPTHTYAAAGNYTVTLTASNVASCSDTVSHIVIVNSLPVVNFAADTVCLNTPPTHFTDLTGTATQWNWDFGDGGNSTLQNPTHTYAASGTYTGSLTATDINGCVNTFSESVIVNVVPVASFTTANVCFPDNVTFTSTSTGPVANYAWNFGDGQFSIMQNPVHNYAAAGTYQVSLVVSTLNNCADMTTQTVVVNPKPVSAFTVQPVCEGVVSVFTNSSSVSNGSIVAYAWSFGDGSFDVQQNTTHTYTTAGTYNAMLIVQTDSGCVDSITNPAIVNPNPVAAFTTGDVCQNQGTVFNNTSTITSGSISQWTWNFGDGQTGNQQNPTHTYQNAGSFTVTLITTSNNNCSDTTTQTDTVEPLPVANFSAPDVCFGVPTIFTDGSYIASGSISAWNWNFGDGLTSTQQNPSHTYQNPGSYNVMLSATSNNNCTDTVTKTVVVNPLPAPNFNAPNVCLGKSTSFTDASTIITGNISAWSWNFGDGNTSNSSSPSNTYVASGVYVVELVLTSDRGCVDSLSKNVTVFTLPVATLNSTPACYSANNGTATAVANGGAAPYSYTWSNGQAGAIANSLYAGTYVVTITDANYCTANASTVVTEPSGPLTVMANPVSPQIALGKSIIINLSNSYNEINASYLTSPAFALSCNDCPQFEASPYQTTTYQVTVTDSNGCTGDGNFTIIVDEAVPVFIPNVFTPNGDGQNDTWGIYSSAIKQVSLSVFNRWGEKVFETDNLNQLWDGSYNGKPAPEGVYVYTAAIVFLDNKTTKLKGSVTLLR